RQAACIPHPCDKRRLIAAVAIEALDGRLDLGLDTDVARRPHPDKQGARFRVDGKRPIGVAAHDPEYAFTGDQPLSVEVEAWFALCRPRTAGHPLLAVSRAQIAQRMRCRPDAVTVGPQNVPLAPSEPVGLVDALCVPLDELRLVIRAGTQQGKMAGFLLSDDDVAVWQHEHPAWVVEPGE